MAPKNSSKKNPAPIVEEAEDGYSPEAEAPEEVETEADAEAETEAQPTKPSRKAPRKTSRKAEVAAKVKAYKTFVSGMQAKRKAASKIPRGGERSEWEAERLEIKAVGYPVLIRKADPSLFYDPHNLQQRVRLAGAHITLRPNKKGEQTEAVVLPRATPAATKLILDIAMTEISRLLRGSQEYVVASRRKNISARDIEFGMARHSNGHLIARLS